MSDSYFKYPRLFGNHSLSSGATCPLDEAQAHYLRNVLRKNSGDCLRVFNGRDGEWLCEIIEIGKKKGILQAKECLKEQGDVPVKLALAFAPIKKQRMDMLIEKAVELGVTDFYPVITHHTENRHLNEERIMRQIIEASEQSERLYVPQWHGAQNLDAFLAYYKEPIYAGIERDDAAKGLGNFDMARALTFMAGPEGGWSEREVALLKSAENITAIGLGEQVLRAETACLAMLAYATLQRAG